MRKRESFNSKNERSLKEVLKEVFSVKDYKKLFPVIEYLDENEEITTQKVEELTEKSSATAWRYLKKLEDAGIVQTNGNTNNSVYKKVKKLSSIRCRNRFDRNERKCIEDV